MNQKPRLFSILAALAFVLVFCGTATAQVTERDNQVVARNQRFGDDLRDSQKLQSDYGNALYKNDCLTARQILASTDNIYAGIVSSVLDKNGYITQFESEEGKASAHALKKVVENIVTQHAKLQQLAGCADKDLPKAATNDKPITDGPAQSGAKENTPGCGVYSTDQRIHQLNPPATALMKWDDGKAAVINALNQAATAQYLQKLVPLAMQFLAVYDAVCAVPSDLAGYSAHVQSLVTNRPVTGPYAKKPNPGGSTQAAPAPKSGSGGLAVPQPAPTPPKIADGPITPPPAPPPQPPVIKDGPQTPTPVTPPQTTGKKTTSKKEKPDKKDEGKKPLEPKPTPTPTPVEKTPEEGGPPRKIAIDPEGGLTVDGGVLHRGTTIAKRGRDDDRPAIAAWVDVTDKAVCAQFKFYQFMKTDFKSQWGSGTEKDSNEDAKKLISPVDKAIVTGTGGLVRPGEWTADDYRDDRHDNPKSNGRFTGDNGREVEAGPYHPQAIPGVKKASGFMDAPKWSPAFVNSRYLKALAPADLSKWPDDRQSPTQPPTTKIGQVKVLQHFRTELHCHQPQSKCLGYFEWDYNETVGLYWEWYMPKEKNPLPKMGMSGGSRGGIQKNQAQLDAEEAARPKIWSAKLVPKSDLVDGPRNITPWKNDCSK